MRVAPAPASELGQPSVGIFWLVDAVLVVDVSTVEEAEYEFIIATKSACRWSIACAPHLSMSIRNPIPPGLSFFQKAATEISCLTGRPRALLSLTFEGLRGIFTPIPSGRTRGMAPRLKRSSSAWSS
jgi:hypothetical protein